jgi:hypothetical protein
MDSSASTFLPLPWSSLAKPALSAALAVGVLTAGQAQALVVKVDGQYWDVSTFNGTYNANKSKFETAANGGVMPWFGIGKTALSFASEVGSSLGLPNFDKFDFPASGGPLFAYGTSFSRIGNPPVVLTVGFNPAILLDPRPVDFYPLFDATFTWAQATRAALPPPSVPGVPGPLPILGVGAAFGYSRKLRKRIKNAKPEVINTTAV